MVADDDGPREKARDGQKTRNTKVSTTLFFTQKLEDQKGYQATQLKFLR